MDLHIKINGDLLTLTKGTANVISNLSGRTCITSLSDSSLRRMSNYLRGCVAEYRYFITLTYPNDKDTWFDCKRHIKNFFETIRRDGFHKKEGFGMFWFLEFQERGAPHIHIYSTHYVSRRRLSSSWFKIVGSEDVKHWSAGTNIKKFTDREHQRKYARKYASKNTQKNLPNMFKNAENFKKAGSSATSIGRFWGVVGLKDTLSAHIVEKVDVEGVSGDTPVINRLIEVLNDASNKDFINYWGYAGGSCYLLRDKRLQQLIYSIIADAKRDKWRRLSADIMLIEQRLANSRLKTLVELQSMQYKMERAKRL